MSDFGPKWKLVRPLAEGGQGHTFIVKRADGADRAEYVLKRLKNPKRTARFEQEIAACEQLAHPMFYASSNVVPIQKGGHFW
jgi:hypothetical protein